MKVAYRDEILQYIAIWLTHIAICCIYLHFAYMITFAVAYAQEVIKKISISAWNFLIPSRQFLRKLSIILKSDMDLCY